MNKNEVYLTGVILHMLKYKNEHCKLRMKLADNDGTVVDVYVSDATLIADICNNYKPTTLTLISLKCYLSLAKRKTNCGKQVVTCIYAEEILPNENYQNNLVILAGTVQMKAEYRNHYMIQLATQLDERVAFAEILIPNKSNPILDSIEVGKILEVTAVIQKKPKKQNLCGLSIEQGINIVVK